MREVIVSSISFIAKGYETITQAVEGMLHEIDCAACEKPDLIVLPEIFYFACKECKLPGNHPHANPETLDGPLVTQFLATAKKHNCYLTIPVSLVREGRRTNSVILADRKGRIAGIYDKYFPTTREMAQGLNVTPGEGAVTLETDFGRVGFVICFDLNFQELREQYYQQGAELLVFSTMFRGGLLARAWAILNRCYFVSAFCGDRSVFINPLGRVFAESSIPNGHIVTRRINLDFVVCHLDWNVMLLEELKKRFGGRYDLEIIAPEGLFLLSSIDIEMTAADIHRQMNFEDLRTYFQRARKVRDMALQSHRLPPGPPAWPD